MGKKNEKVKREVFISLDVESDGPFPGLNSMLSAGYAAFVDGQKEPVSTFYRNLDFIEGATQNPKTMEWWNSTEENRRMYEATRIDTIPGEQFVADFIDWRNTNFPNNEWDVVVVCYPLAYDWKWPDYYFCRYHGENPLGFSRAIDLKSYIFARLGTRWVKTTKRHFPKRWFPDIPHTHHAMDDAIEQGMLFMNVREEFKQLGTILESQK
jgi:hypothetical protein